MLKFNRVWSVLVVCAVVGVAFGAARKITAFQTFDPEPPAADGMAIINYVAGQDKNIAQVILSDFTPNEYYVVVVGIWGEIKVVNACPGEEEPCPQLQNNALSEATIVAGVDESIQANAQGHLTVHLSNAPGEGDEFLDAVAIVSLSDWNSGSGGFSGVSAFGF